MNEKPNPSKHDAAWLGDEHHRLGPEPLTEALDQLYASGPSKTRITAAQNKLDPIGISFSGVVRHNG